MTEPKVVKNCGTLELREDGTLAAIGWHIEGGIADNPAANVLGAIINLLLDARDEELAAPARGIEIRLR